METNLYKILGSAWAVVHNEDKPVAFPDVDKASDYLMSVGVQDEQIDLALIDMLASDNTRAKFNGDGVFSFSDDAKLELST